MIGGTVVFCLIASLLESQLILPGHIAHRKTEGYFLEGSRIVVAWQKFQGKIAYAMEYFAEHGYRRGLRKVLKYRYAAWALATPSSSIANGSSSSICVRLPSCSGDHISPAAAARAPRVSLSSVSPVQQCQYSAL